MEQFDDLFEIGKLVSGYLADNLSEQEQEDLQNWLTASPENELLFEKLTTKAKLKTDYSNYGETNKKAAWTRIVNETGYHSKRKLASFGYRVAAVAFLLLCCSAGLYFYHDKQKTSSATQIANNDIAPGTDQAILKTNGKTIVLGAAKNGVIAQNGQTLIEKSSDGLVSYSGAVNNTITIYDTITIPRKGQHALMLADGSKVWLNSASQLRFPEQFTGNERRVELIYGEAYFEIAHNEKMPFRVLSGKQVIEDIGTKFNVNAYPDEKAAKITLVEGSISIDHKILKPGQQGVLLNGNLSVVNADTEAVTAWKDGDFIFKDEDFKTVMRKIARWYDVDVVYDASAGIDHIPGGWVSRSKPLSVVLRMMEETGKVHFKVQGRRITVTK